MRYLIFAHVFLLVGWGILTSRIPWRTVRGAVSGVLLVWTGFWSWQFAQTREFQAGFPGTREAVAYLDRVRQPGDLVIVSSPFLLPIVQQYAVNGERIFVQYDGDHRRDILGGPPLLQSECMRSSTLTSLEEPRVWTVDASGLFGRVFFIELPDEYRLISEKRFPERYSHPKDVLIREYVRTGNLPPRENVATNQVESSHNGNKQ